MTETRSREFLGAARDHDHPDGHRRDLGYIKIVSILGELLSRSVKMKTHQHQPQQKPSQWLTTSYCVLSANRSFGYWMTIVEGSLLTREDFRGQKDKE